MFVVKSVALLCLLSMKQAAPLACTDLLEPLDQLNPLQLLGRWALVAGTFNDSAHLDFFKLRDSSSIYFSNISETSNASYSPSTRFGGKCYHGTYNVTLEGSTLSFDARDQLNLTVTFMYTSCPDCVVMRFANDLKKTERLWLFSRRREVEMEQLEEFRVQAECLKMLPPAVLDPTKELCQEQ
ncbi:hypothetical protein ATANTOWER_015362 [Ataeniobius toweri]|uniref:Apolipoprotein M n=1 Tax=Ataeniobius toweri TaxID=208326 RepID=A0ABU7C8E2_9TELE|nr:hypothetical protein [Ataeniobius toweri]